MNAAYTANPDATIDFVRIWHDYQEVPDTLRRMNAAYTANPDATIDFVRMSVRQET